MILSTRFCLVNGTTTKLGLLYQVLVYFGMATIVCPVGANKSEYPIAEALKRNAIDDFMGGVDNIDKEKKIRRSFTNHAMFQTWYRMGLMGVFDFMLVNGRQAWNMSTDVFDD
jgi:predicted exporter